MSLLRLKETLTKAAFRPVSARQLGARLQEYLLHEPVAGHRVSPRTPGVIAKVGTGRNAIVRRWEHPELGVLYARAWPYDLRVRPAGEHRHASELFREACLRVPELLLTDESWRTLRRYRLALVVERAAPGQPAEDLDAIGLDLLKRWAGELAQLHSRTGARWGKPWCPENEGEDPKEFWQGRLAKFRRRIPGNTNLLSDSQVVEGLKGTEHLLRSHRFETPTLVHGDINPDNLFIDESGGITWIDFGTVHYGLPAEDLVGVSKWLAPLGLFDEFAQEYRGAGGSPRDHWQPGFDLMQRLMAFEKLSSRIVKTTRRSHIQGKKRDRLLGEQEAYERRLAELFNWDIE
ncbi:aminoglycoside phosphotransferase family protein [bacterium]|nr:aminoglycoside phosphotransferase family protein [bacterium]